MKQKLLNSLRLRVCMLVAILCVAIGNRAWATSYISYNGNTKDASTTISSSNVSSGSAGKISWAGTSCSYSSNRVNIAANGSITFTANTGYNITKIVIVSGSSSDYYGTWSSSPLVTPTLSSGTTTFDGLSASSVTVTTSTAFRCTSASSITIYYEAAPTKTSTTLALSSTNLSNGNLALTVPNGVTETLTATVTPAGGSALSSPNITWTSSNETVATVAAGVVTPLKEGLTTITASYAGDATYGESSGTCVVTVNDGRTPVNLSTFTATNTTLIAGGSPNSTTTSVANDQAGWTAEYTYTSSNEEVATVNASGEITAVAKGTATITCSLNVDAEDEDYKAGTTTSKTIDITVNNPSHTVTFSSNGSAYGESAEVEEGESITLPAANPSVDDKSFCGWVAAPIAGTTNATPDFVTSPVMGTSDVTYYAVFATAVAGSEENTTKTITTSTKDFPTSYGTAKTFTQYTLEGVNFKIQQVYINSGKLQWRSGTDNTNGGGIMYNTDALSKIQNIVIIYSGDNNKNFTVKVGDSENPTSGTSITPTNDGENTYTYDCSSENKSYFVLANGDKAGYLSSIAVTYKEVGPTTYNKYCTTVSDLPLAVVSLSTDAIDMVWGESGKTLTATATVDDEEIDETITFTSSSANLTIDGSGNISCDIPGDYTITASVAETVEHQAGQAICNVTVNKKDIELTFEHETVNEMVAKGEYTQTATTTPAEYDGDITYAITSSTSADAIIDEDTGELLFENTGVIEVTATASATTLYNDNSATYTLYVKTTPTIVVSDQSVAYGSNFTVDDSMIEGGDITVTPASTTIATADGLVLTPVAVGSTTITVSTAATDTYVAGDETFTLTVTAPEGSTAKPSAEPVSVFYESFDQSTGTDGWSGNAGNGTAKFDNDNWTTENGVNGGATCIKLATGSKAGSVTTPSISTTVGTIYTLTFNAGSWSDNNSTLTLNGTGTGMLSTNSIKLDNATFKGYTVTFTATATSAKIKFSAASGKRLFLDEVRITKSGTPIASTSVTTTGNLATYCYEYPLNIDGISGAKAYKVTSVDTEKESVKMEQITGTIKGGVPFILKSDAEAATIEIPLADASTTIPADNRLVGTLAPTFVAQTNGDNTNFAYSKSNKCFVMLGDNGNTVPANRAYLPINLNSTTDVKSFALSFDDADGITSTMDATTGNEQFYNLAGQRISKPVRGINIVGGKKVYVK